MNKEFTRGYLWELKKAIDALPLEKFEEIFSLILEASKAGRQIFIMGNGGSGATASHFACDMNKGAHSGSKKPFKVICLNDNMPTLLAIANDGSFKDIFVEQLKNFLKPGDLVVGLSSSGNSENILRAIGYANKNGAKTIGLTGLEGGKLAKRAHFALVVPAKDPQKVEDIHLVLVHLIKQNINRKRLSQKSQPRTRAGAPSRR